jgi:hypothetical protein
VPLNGRITFFDAAGVVAEATLFFPAAANAADLALEAADFLLLASPRTSPWNQYGVSL